MSLLLFGCATVRPNLTPDRVVPFRTDDGWELGLRHYRGDGPPVLLVHGMGANHYNWDYHQEVSLADYLRDRGWDVWVTELRGDPGTQPPRRRGRSVIDFDDHARSDVPAAVDAVLAATGSDGVYWVGHSMGGMLLYSSLQSLPDRIWAGVAIASPAELGGQDALHRAVGHLGPLLRGKGKIPAAGLARLFASWGNKNPVLNQLANVDNMNPRLVRGMASRALTDLPVATARQAVSWIKTGQIVDRDGVPWVASAETPLLVLGGPLDRVVPIQNVKATCDVFPDCRFVELSALNGFGSDYGHIDPVVGARSRAEIYPIIAGFLDEQRRIREASR